MKTNTIKYHSIKTKSFLFVFLLLLSSCKGQDKIVIAPKQVLESRIIMPAELLPEYKTDNYSMLSEGNQISGVVRTVFQDKKGMYWFGTQNGLCRYNGKKLVYFDIRDDQKQAITVKAIAEDNLGNLWIGHTGGITKYDGKYFTNFTEKNGLINNDVWAIATDKNNTVWIGTYEGVCYYKNEHFTAFEIPEGIKDPTRGVSSPKIIHCIMEDSLGRMWFGGNGGAYAYDGKALLNITKNNKRQPVFVSNIVESKNGAIWMATMHQGLLQYHEASLTKVDDKLLNSETGIGAITETKNGTLWFISDGNIYTYNSNEFTRLEIETQKPNFKPFQIYEDNKERLWFVGFNGAYRYDNKQFVNITREGPW